MDLETQTPKTKAAPSENYDSARQVPQRAKKEKSHRKIKTSDVPVSAVHSPQERLRQRQIDSRSVNHQQIYKLPVLQDALLKRSQTSPATGVLDNLDRFDRRLLACTNRSKQETFSRFPLQGNRLAISGNAVWPQHSTASLYQNYLSCSSRDGPGRNLVSSLPGRPANSGSNKREMYPAHSAGYSNPLQVGVCHQRQQIPLGSSSGFYLARDRVESVFSHSPGLGGQDHISSNIFREDSSLTDLHKKSHNAGSRPSKLHRSVRSSDPPDDGSHKNHFASLQSSATGFSDKDPCPSEAQTLQMEQHTDSPTMPGVTSPNAHHPDGCEPQRLGIPSGATEIPRVLRLFSKSVNQHSGTPDHLVRTVNSTHQGSSHTDSVRQYSSNSSSTTRQFSPLSTLCSSGTGMEKSKKVQLEPHSFPHRGQIQHFSRSTISQCDPLFRMVNSASNLQEDPEVRSTSRGRSVCHSSEQPTSNFCSSLSRPKGNSNRCSFNPMGEMESFIPISSNSTNLEGSGKAHSYTIHQSYSSNSRVTNKTMVYGSPSAQSSFNPPGNSSDSDSGRQTGNSPTSYKTSRLDTIKRTFDTRFPDCPRVVDLLLNNNKPSTKGDYERKWHLFCSYLKERNIPKETISLKSTLKFFAYLFDVKGLKSTTVGHYRSALAVPLKLQYNIDLNDEAVTRLLKGMSLERPSSPNSAPAWCLNKVLSHIDDLLEETNLELSLQKSAFLLLLATGWRISELQACVRDSDFCQFRDDSTLVIRPHPSFLAKNESPDERWQHTTIQPLFLQGGSPSHLCPVKTLQNYIRLTSSFKSGSLFLHHKTGKPLSIKQLSSEVCKLILQADPLVKVKVHDVRKFAAAFTLSETMQASNMIDALHWRSPHTFWKFYMCTTPPLARAAVLPGNSFLKGSARGFSPHQS